MSTRGRAATAVAALMLAGPVPAAERREAKDASIIAVSQDYTIRARAFFPGATEGVAGLVFHEPPSLHRLLVDTKRRLYYGYDITITKGASPNTFNISIQPLSATAERYFLDHRWSQLCRDCEPPRSMGAAQRFPPPRMVRPGEVITLDLLQDDRNGDVVSDEVTIDRTVAEPSPSRTGHVAPPMDLKGESVWLQMVSAKLLVNGEPAVPDANSGGSVQGEIVFTDLPGHGRVYLSLGPQPGCRFKRIGVVAGKAITFTIDGNQYEWVSAGPIATADPVAPFTSSQSWNVWGIRDPDWQSFEGRYEVGGGRPPGCQGPPSVSGKSSGR